MIKESFPKLRLIARGNELKVLGEEKEQQEFEKFFEAVLDHVARYNALSAMELEELLRSSTQRTPKLVETKNSEERSEEHTSELQSRENLVCRLLLEKKKNEKIER